MRVLSIAENPLHRIPYRSARPGGGQELGNLPLLEAEVDGMPEELDAVIVTADLQAREVLPGQRLLGELLAAECVVLAKLGRLPPPERIGVLLAGDFYTDIMASIRGSSGDVRPVWEMMANSFRWVAGVPGNHDELGDLHRRSAGNLRVLDGQEVGLSGLRIAGLGGIIGNVRRPHRRGEDNYCGELRRLIATEPDILVLHQGPGVPEQRLRGSAVVRESLASATKTLVVCGHCHWPLPLAHLPDGPQVLNVDSRCVVLRRAR
jgi:3',5'-cyclic-AMP phosphodiesterase